MTSPDFLNASFPLFESGAVDVLEWSFDVSWDAPIPDWATELIALYSNDDRLLGHIVNLSVFSGKWSSRHEKWMEQFQQECARHKFHHVSEHFGFAAAGRVAQSSPLPVPYSKRTVEMVSERLLRIAELSHSSVGLENLAFAFSLLDLKQQAQLIAEILEKIDGFLLLDLHNMFCQMSNFALSFEDLANLYPLGRVKQIHLSGGSWSTAQDGSLLRRDTHDAEVPVEVSDLLVSTLRKTNNLESIVLERLANTINSDAEASCFRDDYFKLRQTVESIYG